MHLKTGCRTLPSADFARYSVTASSLGATHLPRWAIVLVQGCVFRTSGVRRARVAWRHRSRTKNTHHLRICCMKANDSKMAAILVNAIPAEAMKEEMLREHLQLRR
jgi:hypothetical protein